MLGLEMQKISNYLFRTYGKHTKLVEACKQSDCYYNNNFINLVSFLCHKKYTSFSMKIWIF